MLGVLEKDIKYETGIATLDKNCLLLFYTDGVTEAVNKNDEEFGEEKLIKILTSNHHNNTELILEIIKNEIENHSKGLPQYDDITLIVLKKNK
jgi:phosphoserine phosphatase RsbU/P